MSPSPAKAPSASGTRARARARKRLLAGAIITVLVALLAAACTEDRSAPLELLASAKMAPPGDAEPVPIPGGLQIPEGPLIHVLLPGPQALGFMGENVEPSVITNFNGFTAMGYIVGTATDGDGNTYDMINDMRVFQGQYVSADGTHHRGTFVFI